MFATVASIAKFTKNGYAPIFLHMVCTKMVTSRTIFAVVKQQQQGGGTHSSAKVPDGGAYEYGM